TAGGLGLGAQRPLPELDVLEPRVERLQRRLQLVGVDRLLLGRLLALGALGLLLGLADERLLAQGVVARPHRGLGARLPFGDLAVEICHPSAEALLLGHRLPDLGPRLTGGVLHVAHHLIDLLARILHRVDRVVDVGLDERRKPSEDAHGTLPSPGRLASRARPVDARFGPCACRTSSAKTRRRRACSGPSTAATSRTPICSRAPRGSASAARPWGWRWRSTARPHRASAAAPARSAGASRPAATPMSPPSAPPARAGRSS